MSRCALAYGTTSQREYTCAIPFRLRVINLARPGAVTDSRSARGLARGGDRRHWRAARRVDPIAVVRQVAETAVDLGRRGGGRRVERLTGAQRAHTDDHGEYFQGVRGL